MACIIIPFFGSFPGSLFSICQHLKLHDRSGVYYLVISALPVPLAPFCMNRELKPKYLYKTLCKTAFGYYPVVVMFHYNQKYESFPTTPAGTAHTWSPTSKTRTWGLAKRRTALIGCVVLCFFFMYNVLFSRAGHRVRPQSQYDWISPGAKSL